MEEKLQLQINELNDLLSDIHLKLFSSNLSTDDFEGLYNDLNLASELNQVIDDNINSTNIDFKDAPNIISMIIKLIFIITNFLVGGPIFIILAFYWIYDLIKDTRKLVKIIRDGMNELATTYEQVEKNKQIIQNKKEVLYKKMTRLLEKQNNKSEYYNDATIKLIQANQFISNYINDDQAFMIDEETKDIAISILQYDLETDIYNLKELLELAKNKAKKEGLMRKRTIIKTNN